MKDFPDWLRGHNLPGWWSQLQCSACGGQGVTPRLLPSGADIPTCSVCNGAGRVRRMQANPSADKRGYEHHQIEHDEDSMCKWTPTCTPVEVPR